MILKQLKRLFGRQHISHEFSDTRGLEIDHIGSSRTFIHVDDQILEFNGKAGRAATLIVFGGGGGLWFILGFYFRPNPEVEPEYVPFLLIMTFLFCVLPCLWVLPRSCKVYVFDRMHGTITMTLPRTFKNYGKNPGQITFDFATARFDTFVMQAGRPRYLNVRFPNQLMSQNIPDIMFLDALQLHTFLVWYMDKNRPLPPGEIFDNYRECDYQRRKAEGFPDPLYLANILTPENTPEREKERMKREVIFMEKVERELNLFKLQHPTEFDEFKLEINELVPNVINEFFSKNRKTRKNQREAKKEKEKGETKRPEVSSEMHKNINEYNAYRDRNKKT